MICCCLSLILFLFIFLKFFRIFFEKNLKFIVVNFLFLIRKVLLSLIKFGIISKVIFIIIIVINILMSEKVLILILYICFLIRSGIF